MTLLAVRVRDVPFDDGHAVHYLSVQPGTPVLSADEAIVGKVIKVLDNYRENFLDGIVIEVKGHRRFVDAPEVARTAERAVTLSITSAEVEALPPPAKGPPLRRRLSRLVRVAGTTLHRGRGTASAVPPYDHLDRDDDDDDGDGDGENSP